MLKYFRTSFIFSFVGLILAYIVASIYTDSTAGIVQYLFITVVLSILEISLSFDNAVVNAKVLETMTPVWRHRFITWGMLIAVFGMRLIFPLAIVSVMTSIGPWEALVMAAQRPKEYADIMLSSHVQISAFGGSFLLMVALRFFLDHHKDDHWIQWIENPLAKLGKLESVQIGLTVMLILIMTKLINEADQMKFLIPAIWGVVVHILVDGMSSLLKSDDGPGIDLGRASAASFIYLEVLDASFSFDGVVGAFAITSNLFIIMIGLSVGAFFVRSLTIFFVEEKTLKSFRFLEHGAFYAILTLAIMMLLGPFVHIPEWITGVSGAVLIALSIFASIQHKKKFGT
ncbi:MAG: DUF475 domain-containing protein [Pseudobdellovibrionaceae bacterium]|jgi:hypothetical protein